ncbi:SEL1-like repeat protein [Sneathiella aquimaris]|uniref:hypothetical protein n=1 Tax=Sneathiella aquimaris TaxID=2599305 RepID=UPI00146F0508|nr:hypothetical protein [Sneathiella aquimaris]
MKRVGFVVGLALLTAGQAWADFQSGLDAYNKNNFSLAVELWSNEASQGDLNSQYNLGLLFEKGVEGFPKDLSAAYGWYRLAAAQGAPQAEQAISRIKPIMTAGQIDAGNEQAIQIFGKWFRKNIGRSEAEYQAAKAKLEADRKAQLEVERKASAARAQRQRDLAEQRKADAQLADQLERESRQAAIKAAQEKAEETKRRALIEQRRREEEERLAALQAEQDKQRQMNDARARLAELQAKSNGGAVVVPQASPTQPVAGQSSATVAAAQPTVQTSPAATTARSQPVAKAAPTPAIEAAPSQSLASKTNAASDTTMSAPVQTQPVVKTPTVATQSTQAPTIKNIPAKAPAVKAATPTQATLTQATKVPAAKTTASKQASVVAKAASPKVSVPVLTNGLDAAVITEIVAAANRVPLDTPAAKAEISKGRTDIEALKWSLISAARGKGSAKKMNAILVQSMSPVQIAEANRLAAEWISKRQKRQ